MRVSTRLFRRLTRFCYLQRARRHRSTPPDHGSWVHRRRQGRQVLRPLALCFTSQSRASLERYPGLVRRPRCILEGSRSGAQVLQHRPRRQGLAGCAGVAQGAHYLGCQENRRRNLQQQHQGLTRGVLAHSGLDPPHEAAGQDGNLTRGRSQTNQNVSDLL